MSSRHHNPVARADLAPADEVGTADGYFDRCDGCGTIYRTENDHSEFCPVEA